MKKKDYYVNKILNFIIKNTGSHNYKEVFEIIDDLIFNKQITLDTIIKKKDQNEISLKDFIIEFYKENSFDVDIVNFINKYGININFDNEDSYLSLMKFLNKCLLLNKDEIESSWEIFKEKTCFYKRYMTCDLLLLCRWYNNNNNINKNIKREICNE